MPKSDIELSIDGPHALLARAFPEKVIHLYSQAKNKQA